MARTQIKKDQAFDPDFALQSELDAVSGAPFTQSMMNNKMLRDVINILKDNGINDFNPSTMNNKQLYDLWNALILFDNIYSGEYNVTTQVSWTSMTQLFETSPLILPTGTYRINTFYRYRNLNTNVSYLETAIRVNGGTWFNLMHQLKRNPVVASANYPINGFVILSVPSNASYTIQWGTRVTNSSRPYSIWDWKYTVIKVD